jgi:hypothetical protein
VIDLRSEAVVAATDVGLLSEEIAIDAASRWVVVSGEGTTRLMDVATLRTVGRFDHLFYGKGLDTGAELAFDDESSYLLIRPTNPPRTANVYVVSTRPDEWYQLACETAGRSLTSVEWAEHVGLTEFEPACG